MKICDFDFDFNFDDMPKLDYLFFDTPCIVTSQHSVEFNGCPLTVMQSSLPL